MNYKSQTKGTYNASAQAMSEKFDAIGPRVRDILLAFSYNKKDNPAVLEIGCGNGRDAKEILKHTSRYIGLDYSQALLDIARVDLPEAKFELADIEDYEFPEGIDVVFSFASLLHSNKKNMERVLAKVYQALNSGGVLFLSLKHAPYREEVVTDAWGTRVFYFYTPEDIRRLAGKDYKVVHENVHTVKNGSSWFEIILQK